eukprot:Skav215914  [mRNA]  locus=scaffold226:62232:63857:- [translate_table: standard]
MWAKILDFFVASLGEAFFSSKAETTVVLPLMDAKHSGDHPPSSYSVTLRKPFWCMNFAKLKPFESSKGSMSQ